MKKSLQLLSILLIGIVVHSIGQDTIHLTFTAKYNQEHLTLDSILIMNLTQETKTTLYAPDTMLTAEYYPAGWQGIDPVQHDAYYFAVSQNYPNPFKDKTSVDISLAETDRISIRVYDLSGREHASWDGVLNQGKHTFTFYPGNEDFYLFSANYKGLSKTTKILNTIQNQSNCQISYTGFEKQPSMKKIHTFDYFRIYENDILRYFGYANIQEGFLSISGSDFIENMPENCDDTLQFEIVKGVPCMDVITVDYEGKIYNTVQIGSQCWLKENLNVGNMILGILEQTDNDTLEKYCHFDSELNCDKFGGLYQWNEAMIYSQEPGIQGICPPGWHIPTDEEFKQLEGTVDSQYGYPDPIWDSAYYRGFDVGKNLKASFSWQSGINTNKYGFYALGTGCRFIDGTFVSLGRYTSMWTSDMFGGYNSLYRHLEHNTDMMSRASAPRIMGRSLRCLKDE